MPVTILPFFNVINIIFFSLALNWVNKMHSKHCACAEEWRLDFIKAFFIISTIWNALLLLSVFSASAQTSLVKYLAIPVMLLTILYAGIGLSYYVDLKKKQCECSAGGQRNMMYIMSIIQVISVGLGFLGFIYLRYKGII
jgi:hypothetical protein